LFDAGLAEDTDDFVAGEAKQNPAFLRNLSQTEFLDWLNIADTCILEKLAALCALELLFRGKVS